MRKTPLHEKLAHCDHLVSLLGETTIHQFLTTYLYRRAIAKSGTALHFRKLIGWPLLHDIFRSGHRDCWLPSQGRLPEAEELKSGQLTFEQAYSAFSEGRSVLVRHAELAHSELRPIADSFERSFEDSVDLQIYATPAGGEGFDWHYDIEDVFVIQSSGEKEFRLLTPRAPPSLSKVDLNVGGNFAANFRGPEIRCHLKAGDFLYIPAGVWHKARAITPSFHLSIGVLSSRHPARDSANLT